MVVGDIATSNSRLFPDKLAIILHQVRSRMQKTGLLIIIITIGIMVLWGTSCTYEKPLPSSPPTPSPTYEPSLYGTVRFFVKATSLPENVTSMIVTFSRIQMYRVSFEKQRSTSHLQPIDITNNIYSFDLIRIHDTEQFLGESCPSVTIKTYAFL